MAKVVQIDTGFFQFEHVYFIKAGNKGPVKIGLGREPIQRLNQLQTASWEELRLILILRGGGAGVEQHLHERFKNEHIRGEWYQFTGLIAEFYADCVRVNDTGLDPWKRKALLSLALEAPLDAEMVRAFVEAKVA